MISVMIVCARCTLANHASDRYCASCGLPMGSLQPDAEAGSDALEPYEHPEPADPDVTRLIAEFVRRTRHDANPSGRGWQLVVPLRLDRKQAVYVGPAGTDSEGRAIMGLVSVCGPVNDRDCRTLLKLNARIVEGHFAVRVLRGEEYFVVIENLPVDATQSVDAPRLVRHVAELADGLEDRLSRGRDIY
ncbi:MAG TPA: zinc finger Ran-binding domain-containing protein [Isosphaeraceae bacterium]|nr:zinc finger Ran-binding domain-containing protein [Isosphaeraceae bacterium]